MAIPAERFASMATQLPIGGLIKADEWLYMLDPSRMFHLKKGKLSTNVIYHSDNAFCDIGPESIGGIRDYSWKRKKAIRSTCSIKLNFRDRTPVPHIYQLFEISESREYH